MRWRVNVFPFRRNFAAMVAGILLVGLVLRLVGLQWGIDGGPSATGGFHPDETVGINGVRQIDLLRGQLRVPSGYFEGTFSYYVFAAGVVLTELISGDAAAHPSSFPTILLVGRMISVLADLGTILIVFLMALRITQRAAAAVIAAAAYAVTPLAVIYAHFMRPHSLTNFLCGLVIYLSIVLSAQGQRTWLRFALVGLIAGLATATRYTMVILLAVPCLFFLMGQSNTRPALKQVMERALILLRSSVWILLGGFVVGLFIGEPILFFEPRTVIEGVRNGTVPFIPAGSFQGSGLLNLAPVLNYIRWLIPAAMYPLLWLPAYASLLLLCFRPRWWRSCLPLAAFLVLYTVPMAKGYANASFARATLPLLPVLAVFIAILVTDVLESARLGRRLGKVLVALLWMLLVPSILFDWAYVHAMRQPDPRSRLREDVKFFVAGRPATIGVSETGIYFYTAMPAVEPLASSRVSVPVQPPDTSADLYVVGFPGGVNPATIAAIERAGLFKPIRTYTKDPKLFGRSLSLSGFPPDMLYPFPTLVLFGRKAEE